VRQIVSLAIGGMVWGVETHGAQPLHLASDYLPFLVDRPPTQHLSVSSGNGPPAVTSTPLFETGTTWTLYETQAGYLLTMPAVASKRPMRQWARFNTDFQEAELFIERNSLPIPIYPFDQLWAMHLLAQQGGLLCHSCAVAYEGQGLLFLGHSGGGKSTMARLWSSIPGATILSDERIIIRQEAGGYRLYGTPWSGEGKFSSPMAVPLKRLYILAHGPVNAMTPLSRSAATAAVLTRSLVPFWHRALMDHSLQFVTTLCRDYPVNQLEFVPDQRIVEFLQP
jgi:hypothetical protein